MMESSGVRSQETELPAGCGLPVGGLGPGWYRRWLWGIVVVAVVARVGLVVFAELRPARFDFPDSDRYVLVGQNIAAGRGPIEAGGVRAGTDPLYPAILAAGVLLGCDDAASVMRFGRMVNGLIGVASVLLLAVFARRLVGDRAALVAAAILAVDPILLFFNALVLTETCYIALLLGGFCCLTRAGDRGGVWWAAAAGLLLGLGTLARSSSLFLPIMLVPLVWHFAGRCVSRDPPNGKRRGGDAGWGRRGGPAVACFLLATAVVLVPTVVRNHRLFGHVVPVRTGSGASLREALGPWVDGGPGMDRIAPLDYPAEADEYVRDQMDRAAAIEWAWDHPGEVLSLAWVKLRRTWSVSIHASGYRSPVLLAVSWMSVVPEFILAAGGIWWLRRRPQVVWLLVIVGVYFSIVHMVFVGSVRYRVPAMPFVFVLSGVAVDRLWGRRGEEVLSAEC